MTDQNGSHVSTTDAIEAMRRRGIDDPESLVSSTTADRIIATCEWYDGLTGVTKGLLVKRIKEGGVEPTTTRPKLSTRERFAKLTELYSEGSVTESHKRMANRQWPHDQENCAGAMVLVEDPAFPSMTVRCDQCGFEAAYPFKALAAGVIPDRPPVNPRPVPDAQPQVPEGQRRPLPAARPSVRGVHPVRLDERSLRWRR